MKATHDLFPLLNIDNDIFTEEDKKKLKKELSIIFDKFHFGKNTDPEKKSSDMTTNQNTKYENKD